MKLLFSLIALFFSISLLLFHSNSFSNAQINNTALLSIVSEEKALIAINYVEGTTFSVTNNTARAINIDRINFKGESDHKINRLGGNANTSIPPEGAIEFNITGDPEAEGLSGNIIQIVANWNGGSAEIESIIPELDVEEAVPEVIKEEAVPEVIEEEAVLEVIEEEAVPEVIEEEAFPKVKEDETELEETTEQDKE